ncbi:hypothetical protein [Plesiomonas shigelloides]|uniref:hypothetical protein n=1 Tax=Plesiomonas shigelloides TaxID=703 RepID=UPI0032601F79
MKSIIALSSVVLLSGCVGISPETFVGPNGKTAYSMECSGMGRTLNACYKKAGDVCPGGYQIIENSSEMNFGRFNGNLMVANKRSLVIECK